MDKRVEVLNKHWPEWTVQKQIGSGSFGTVYETVKKEFNIESHSAVKVISIPASDGDADALRAEGMSDDEIRIYYANIVRDCVAEIELMVSFKGIQNIVNIEDYKVVENEDSIGWTILIRMEYLTTFTSFANYMDINEREVLKLGIDICTALEFCEKRNVIHRDIKPSNIFVNQFGNYKLGDFGIARTLDAMAYGMSQKGSPNYMAPEVWSSTNYDHTVDLYSLGITLYQYLNGRRLPFIFEDSQQYNLRDRQTALMRRLGGEILPPPSDATLLTSEVILKACEPDSSKRYRNAAEMKQALLYALTQYDAAATNGFNSHGTAPLKKKNDRSLAMILTIAGAVLGLLLISGVVVFLVSGKTPENKKTASNTETKKIIKVVAEDDEEDEDNEESTAKISTAKISKENIDKESDSDKSVNETAADKAVIEKSDKIITGDKEQSEISEGDPDGVNTQTIGGLGAASGTLPTAAPTVTPTETPTPTKGPVTASSKYASNVSLEGCQKVSIINATSSSHIIQDGYDNTANAAIDGSVVTSWQEGVAGNGEGEYLSFTFNKVSAVKVITLNLGNWRDNPYDYYHLNARPKKLKFVLDGQEFYAEFGDEKREVAVVFSEPVSSASLKVEIVSVYPGDDADDTCIAEISVYEEK